ncbi:phenylalanine--tRNA ligase beta subunit-related protein, partial [Staphylococcus aureus]|uniref:phenylalanine--tRNA ligase beta subunit-related protein n=1 Tax=Staphylococcus aureus TaxID=1280 RepID=UPI00237ACF42
MSWPARAAALLAHALLAQNRGVEAEALSHESESLAGDDLKAAIAWRGVRAEALARRALRGEALPAINALVDIGNLISLHHLVPVGGHAIDGVTGDIALRPATGQESFVPFGSDQVECPLPGEVIFAEGDTVLTR